MSNIFKENLYVLTTKQTDEKISKKIEEELGKETQYIQKRGKIIARMLVNFNEIEDILSLKNRLGTDTKKTINKRDQEMQKNIIQIMNQLYEESQFEDEKIQILGRMGELINLLEDFDENMEYIQKRFYRLSQEKEPVQL